MCNVFCGKWKLEDPGDRLRTFLEGLNDSARDEVCALLLLLEQQGKSISPPRAIQRGSVFYLFGTNVYIRYIFNGDSTILLIDGRRVDASMAKVFRVFRENIIKPKKPKSAI